MNKTLTLLKFLHKPGPKFVYLKIKELEPIAEISTRNIEMQQYNELYLRKTNSTSAFANTLIESDFILSGSYVCFKLVLLAPMVHSVFIIPSIFFYIVRYCYSC